jgi:hypothetical protein
MQKVELMQTVSRQLTFDQEEQQIDIRIIAS